ncbi:MAG: hypothetical protein QXU20_03255, partial [Candidatus Woesearchaeota archaeon]
MKEKHSKKTHENNEKFDFMDKVLIKLKDKTEFKGLILKSPENDNRIFIKLENGYNIGFNPENIESISVLEKAKKQRIEKTISEETIMEDNK